MRFLSATIVCLLLGSAGVIADQKNTPKKHKDATHAVVHRGDADVTTLGAHVSWTTHEVEIIRRLWRSGGEPVGVWPRCRSALSDRVLVA